MTATLYVMSDGPQIDGIEEIAESCGATIVRDPSMDMQGHLRSIYGIRCYPAVVSVFGTWEGVRGVRQWAIEELVEVR